MTQLDAHVFVLPNTVCGAGRAQWAQCLEAFSDRNAGRMVTVEEDLSDLGAAPAAVNARLAGIAYDRHDGSVQIMLGGVADMRHQTVVAQGVLGVDTLVTSAGRDVALRLAVLEGQVLVTFTPPVTPAAGNGKMGNGDGWPMLMEAWR
jgi:hypothetical protein